MKIKKTVLHLNHYDLDCVACALALNGTFDSVHMIPTGYGKLPAIIKNIETHITKRKYDEFYITDLNLSKKQYDYCKAVANKHGVNITYIDHHESGIEEMHSPKENRFVFIEQSAGLLTKNYLEAKYGVDLSYLNSFIKLSNDYDLWIHKYPESKALNFIYDLYRPYKMIKRFANGLDEFTKKEKLEIIKRFNEIEEAWEKLEILDDDTYKISAIFTKGRLINEMADKTLKLDNIDIVIVFTNDKSISVRCNLDEIAVGSTLELIGGGGHRHAGGVEFIKRPEDKDDGILFNINRIKKVFTESYNFLGIVF